MIEQLSDKEIKRRLTMLDAEPADSTAPTVAGSAPTSRWIRPLADEAASLLDALRVEDGIGLGLAEIDTLTRGFRAGDCVYITGFAHSSKSGLAWTAIVNNPHKRVIVFSLDDPASMVLLRLTAMVSGISAVNLEERVRLGDDEAAEIIRQTTDHFPHLIIVDDGSMTIPDMQDAVEEATAMWGAPPDAVIIDYLEMIPHQTGGDDASTVKQKANDLKRWAKRSPFPLIVLHQGTRSNARPGEPITLLSMGFSGEQQATIVLGVRRKRDLASLDPWERSLIEDTVTIHCVKNKRPGGRCTHFEGIDFHLEPATGLIRPIRPDERRLVDPDSAAARAERAAQQEIF